jgi:hypothetical protein
MIPVCAGGGTVLSKKINFDMPFMGELGRYLDNFSSKAYDANEE